jgi:hypothetical protein
VREAIAWCTEGMGAQAPHHFLALTEVFPNEWHYAAVAAASFASSAAVGPETL